MEGVEGGIKELARNRQQTNKKRQYKVMNLLSLPLPISTEDATLVDKVSTPKSTAAMWRPSSQCGVSTGVMRAVTVVIRTRSNAQRDQNRERQNMSRLPVHAICGLTKHPQRGRVITEFFHNCSFILASGDDLASCPTERQARPSARAGRDVWTQPVKDLLTRSLYLTPNEPRWSCLGDRT